MSLKQCICWDLASTIHNAALFFTFEFQNSATASLLNSVKIVLGKLSTFFQPFASRERCVVERVSFLSYHEGVQEKVC